MILDGLDTAHGEIHNLKIALDVANQELAVLKPPPPVRKLHPWRRPYDELGSSREKEDHRDIQGWRKVSTDTTHKHGWADLPGAEGAPW